MKVIDHTIVALDNMSKGEIYSFLDSCQGKVKLIKIGLEVFCGLGPDFVKEISNHYDVEIFLDLKLHDIPNTVRKAIKSLTGLPIKFLTIHLSGGKEMITQALSQANESLPHCTILGVSYLTSLNLSDINEIWGLPEADSNKTFTQMFNHALDSGIQGMVLSAKELPLLKSIESSHGRSVVKVTPGIRFQDEIDSGTNIGDQSRVLNPFSAMENGANFLVMGRSLTQADDITKRLEQLSR